MAFKSGNRSVSPVHFADNSGTTFFNYRFGLDVTFHSIN